MEKFINFLLKNQVEHRLDYEISELSSIRLGARQRLVVFPRNTKTLIKILTFLWQNKERFVIVGNLSNVLFAEDVGCPVIVTNQMQDEFEVKGAEVTVPCGMMLTRLCEFTRKNCLSGIEGLFNIPATVGGAIISNAGAFGYEISDRLVRVQVFFNGKIFELNKKDIKFCYHYSNLKGFVCLKATFLFENKKEYDIMNLFNEFTYKRNMAQPSGFSLGSVYKKVNGKSAGFYIERSGLKGTRIGGLVVSKKHANFFINDKCGSVSDFLRLSALVEASVLKQFGVTLTKEIEKLEAIDETYCGLAHALKT